MQRFETRPGPHAQQPGPQAGEKEKRMKLTTLLTAGMLLVQPLSGALAASSDMGAQGTVSGFVVPHEVQEKEPFTFAAKGVIEGEVIEVKTVEGEVVATKKADKYGRIFLAAGLAAGSYLLSHHGGKSSAPLLVGTGGHEGSNPIPTDQVSLSVPPSSCSVSEGLTLSGTGMSGNAEENVIKIGDHEVPVLASTAREVQTGELAGMPCGYQPIHLENTKSGKHADVDKCLVYDLKAKIGRQKLVSGEQTALEFSFLPKEIKAMVSARILSGPVSFKGGKKETQVAVSNGAASLPLIADPAGSGPFRVAFDFAGVSGENSPTAGGQDSKEPCPKTLHKYEPLSGWKSGEKDIPDPDDPKKKKHVYTATQKSACFVHSHCGKTKGHDGDCSFSAKKRCTDKTHPEKTDEKQFDTKEDRDKFLKDNR
jgi:hypothetical protein